MMQLAQRVILIVIDGLRPDALVNGSAPNLKRLMANGAYSLTAQSVMPSITLPTHLSLFYGVSPEVHQVKSNVYLPNPALNLGIVERVHEAGMEAASFYSWEQLRDLWRPGSIKHTYFLNIYSSPERDFDREVAAAAADYLMKEPPDFTFVYLGVLDELAHKVGWMSEKYFEGIESADAAVGYLLGRLEAGGLLEGTAVLVQADHGGHARGHGTDQWEDMTIPWILSGAGVGRGVRLETPVSLLDTAPTILHLLGLEAGPSWAGRVITEALA